MKMIHVSASQNRGRHQQTKRAVPNAFNNLSSIISKNYWQSAYTLQYAIILQWVILNINAFHSLCVFVCVK